jgi:hypothetical protein
MIKMPNHCKFHKLHLTTEHIGRPFQGTGQHLYNYLKAFISAHFVYFYLFRAPRLQSVSYLTQVKKEKQNKAFLFLQMEMRIRMAEEV